MSKQAIGRLPRQAGTDWGKYSDANWEKLSAGLGSEATISQLPNVPLFPRLCVYVGVGISVVCVFGWRHTLFSLLV